MKDSTDKWVSGDAYEHFMGRWSQLVAQEFIHWLNPPPAWNWLDVGCGTGALTRAICRDAKPASVVACDPSPQFISFARNSLDHPSTTFLVAGADALPNSLEGFDAIISGLVLNFIPAPVDAVKAMSRRLRPGGLLAAYVWDYAEGMQFLRIFWDEAIEMDPSVAALDEKYRFPICQPDALIDLMRNAGFDQVEVKAIEITTPFSDFETYWAPFLGGTGSAPSYVATLDPAAREQLRHSLQQRFLSIKGGTDQLTARAWAVRGFLATAA